MLQNAYFTVDYSDAKHALQTLLRELMHLNPSAARSLEEGLQEIVGSIFSPESIVESQEAVD